MNRATQRMTRESLSQVEQGSRLPMFRQHVNCHTAVKENQQKAQDVSSQAVSESSAPEQNMVVRERRS